MEHLIGNTPMIELSKSIAGSRAKVFVKLEEYNWGGSIKSRVGHKMIIDAEANGLISKNAPDNIMIVEASGGNTGMGIAQMCSLRGYKCLLVVPDNYNKSRIKILQAMGAQVLLSDHNKGNDSHFRKIEEIVAERPECIWLNQLDNPSNVSAHYLYTGNEILNQIGMAITHFVAGVGSGGSITGIGKAIKEQFPNAQIIAVQPRGCDILKGIAVTHKIQGLAIGRVPAILDSSIINQVVDVDEQDVFDYQIEFLRKTGLLLGYSSIANILASFKIARTLDENGVVVTLSPDSGRNYIAEREIRDIRQYY